jgi:acetyltransferase
LLADPNVDAGLAIVVPTKSVAADEIATSLARARVTGKPVAACVLGEYGERARAALEDARVPVYAFPENAAAAFAVATRYARYCARPLDAAPCERPRSRRVAIAGERWLDPHEVETILDEFGVHMAASRVVTSRADAARAATDLGFPVALKIVSRTITHKSDVGGVILALPDGSSVERAYAKLESHVTELGRRDELDGVLVQKMAPAGLELFVGMTRDPQFGPLVAFGIGGTRVELWGDVALRIAPLGSADADEMLDAIRARKLLDGYRGAPGADRASVRDTLLAVSHLAMDAPEIVELDINPLVALGPGRGVVAVDARIRVGRP